MARRKFILLALAGLFLPAHAPYGQWAVFRKKYLLILSTREDPPSFDLAQTLSAALLRELPESRAQASRAPSKARIAALLSSHQMELALMRPDDAASLREGVPPFKNEGPVPLMTLATFEDFILVCRDDFPALHAWLIAEAMSRTEFKQNAPDRRLPLHPGVKAFQTGGEKPAKPVASEAHDH